MAEETPAYRPRCMNLYCKSMLVYGEAFESDPEYQMGATEFWCLCTSKGQGPDGAEVSLDRCTASDRECFREY
jgi:hypothetical protein